MDGPESSMEINRMPPPLISVILPVYNGAAYLREALESLRRQTFRDFEVIIIDDCSTDESPNIAESFDDPRFHLIRAAARLRISHALNLGITHAQGQLIARMDADDLCHPIRLERQFTFLSQHPQIGFCGSWVKRFGKDLNPQTYRRPVGPARVSAFSIFDNPIVHSSVMIRHNILTRLDSCYRNEFVDAEDYDLWTRLLEFTQGDNIPEVLLDYRVHAQSVTLQKTDSMDRMACRILKRTLARVGLEVSDEEVLRHRLWSTGRLDLKHISESLGSAEKWLTRLLATNQTSHTFDTKALLWAAREIWFTLCYRALMAGTTSLKPIFYSPISLTDFKNFSILACAITKRQLKPFTQRTRNE